MNDLVRFLFFASYTILLIWLGTYLYRRLNQRLLNSSTGWGLFGYSILLFISLGLVYFGGVYLFIQLYSVWKSSSGTVSSNPVE